jgi:hypothetical protein
VHDVIENDDHSPAQAGLPVVSLVTRVTIKRHIRDLDPSHESGGSDAKILGDTPGQAMVDKSSLQPSRHPQSSSAETRERSLRLLDEVGPDFELHRLTSSA